MENEVKDRLLHIMPTVRVIYLFGSFAKSEGTQDSDNDIGFIAEKSLSPIAWYNIK